jgi:hypothetical protein
MFYVLFMCKCVLPPGFNPIAVDEYINININLYGKKAVGMWGWGLAFHTSLSLSLLSHKYTTTEQFS